LGFVLLDL